MLEPAPTVDFHVVRDSDGDLHGVGFIRCQLLTPSASDRAISYALSLACYFQALPSASALPCCAYARTKQGFIEDAPVQNRVAVC